MAALELLAAAAPAGFVGFGKGTHLGILGGSVEGPSPGEGKIVSLEGRLLISKPAFHDDSFSGTVTFLVEHDQGGAIGLILNRPSELHMADAFSDWGTMAPTGEPIFSGGPVETGSMVVLADGDFDDGDLALGLRSIDMDQQVPLARAEGIQRIRVFSGYAGWAPDQLEGELAVGAWWLVEATKGDVFCDHPDKLWADVLARNGGEMAWFAHYPRDPSRN